MGNYNSSVTMLGRVAIFCFAFFLTAVLSQDVEQPCRDFTVGGCSISEEYLLWSSEQVEDSSLCQFACESFTHCLLFRKTEGLCELTTHDFRENCSIVSATVDGNLQQCLTSNLNGCNGFIDENCTFQGLSLGLDPPAGEIQSPTGCEKLCRGFQVLGCNYWVFNTIDLTCQLLDSEQRTCTGISGPGYPSLAECREGEGPTAAP